MLLIGKTRRKLRPFFRYLFLCVGIFCIVVGLCFLGVFIAFTHPKLVSPLGKVIHVLQRKNTLEDTVKENLGKYNIQYLSIAVKNTTITIVLPNDIQVLLTTQKDISSQIASLQLTIQNLTIEKKTPRKIDFRFDREVISF